MAKNSKHKVFPNSKIKTDGYKNRIEQSKNYNFVEFSEIPEYRDVNEELLRTALKFLPANQAHIIHVDNATGTGLIPQLAAKLYLGLGKTATIIGIDPDLYALQQAAEAMKDVDVELLLFQGYGQDLQELLKGHIPKDGVDVVSIHDAIHEIPGFEVKKAIFAAQAKVLRPGGIQTYNSSFTTIGLGESAMHWGRWKLEAFSLFKEGRNKSVTAIELNSPDDYKQMIKDSGLNIVYERVKPVDLSRKALEAISRYPEFVNGVFRDMENVDKYSLTEKSKALIDTLDKLNIQSLSRQWHEIVAQKSS